jgi:hypothetical protein
MKTQRVDSIRNKPNIMNKLQRHAKAEDISINIFRVYSNINYIYDV